MSRRPAAVVVIAALAGLQAVAGIPAQAAPGDLDSSFAGDGKVTTDFPPPGGPDQGNAVVVDSGGNIVVAGWTEQGGTRDFALARYLTGGVLDPSFGGGDGLVITDFFDEFDEATSVAIDSAGRIVVAGVATDAGNRNFVVARYLTGGGLDLSFGGGDGFVTTDFGGDDQANAVAIRSGDAIVAAGVGGFIGDFALAGYTSAGAPDAGFGTGGVVTTDFAGGTDSAAALAIQSDGKIVAAGRATTPLGEIDFGVARYETDGDPDLPFGGGGTGWVTTHFGTGVDEAFGVAIQSDDKIVAAGVATTAAGGLDFGLARYTTGGALDTGFSAPDGLVTTDFDSGGADTARDVTIQANGKIVAAGLATVGGEADFGLARYTTAGALDTGVNGFSVDGKVNTDFDVAGGADQAYGVAIQPADGKIVAAGGAEVGMAADLDFAVARYDSDSLVPPSADLSITKSDSPDPVAVGGVLTYTLIVANAGPDPAIGVTVSDILPPSVTVLSATSSQGSCTPGAITTCALSTIDNGDSATVTITVQPNSAGTITDTATVSSPVADPDLDNNSASADTTVEAAPPACTITGTAGNDSLVGTPGDDVICGLGGDDSISAGAGNDTVAGGPGNDSISGGAGNDTINGDTGNDSMAGFDGNDTITGGAGNDAASGGNGDDTLDSRDGVFGNDSNSGGPGNDTCFVDPGDATSC